jgi:hypothetical protein
MRALRGVVPFAVVVRDGARHTNIPNRNATTTTAAFLTE